MPGTVVDVTTPMSVVQLTGFVLVRCHEDQLVTQRVPRVDRAALQHLHDTCFLVEMGQAGYMLQVQWFKFHTQTRNP